MKKLTYLIALLFTVIPLFADVLEEDLYFIQNYDRFRKLKKNDFEEKIDTDSVGNIETGKIAILINFKGEISYDFLSLYVNDKQIDDLYYMGNPDVQNNCFSIEIKNKYLVKGKNTIEFYYQNNEIEDGKKWIFQTSGIQNKEFSTPIQLTKGAGWKRNFRVSPNGRFVAYVMIDADVNAIKIFDLEKKTEKVLVQSEIEKQFGATDKDKFYSFAPCWSRMGNFIFYVSTESGNYELYRAEVLSNGDIINNIQLTNFGSYCTDLVASINEDNLFFISNKDGDKMELYVLENAVSVQNSIEAKDNMVLISDMNDQGSIFSPALSHDGKIIAYCRQKSGSNTTIETMDLSSKQKRVFLKNSDNDCLYPSWSPKEDVLCYYRDRNIYMADYNEEFDEVKIAENIIIPTYAIKPSWDPLGNSLYYIKNDDNNSLRQVIVDVNKFKKIQDKVLIDDRYYRNNLEIMINSKMDYIIYNSFKTGTWQMWALHQNIEETNSILKMEIKEQDVPILFYSILNKKYEMAALSPRFVKKNAFLETENILPGNIGVKFDGNEFVKTTSPYEIVSLSYDEKVDKHFPLKETVFSTFVPGTGQYAASYRKKGNFFLWSFLGLAAAGTGGYFLADSYHDDYMKSDNMEDLINNRNKYNYTLSLTNGVISSGVVLYCWNLFDAVLSKKSYPTQFYEKHDETYRKIKSKIPQKRKIYAKENTGNGELKIFVNQPKTNIFLAKKGEEFTKDNYFGETNFTFDKDTYFTIGDLKPGQYTLECKKPFFSNHIEDITIDEYNTSYSLVKMEQTFYDKLLKNLKCAVPGYVQLSKKENVKGYTISTLAGGFLVASLISQAQTNSDVKKYNKADNLDDIIKHKDNYYKHSSNRNAYLVMFSLTWVYNLYDTVVGG